MTFISIHEQAADLASAAAELITTYLSTAPGSTTIGLSGGSTPAETYRRLAESNIDWSRVTTWLGDERWVPADHSDSNIRMIGATLGPGADRLLRPDTTLDDPHEAARRYDEMLGTAFSADPEGRPGLILLGIGDDGHTASLFPGSDALGETERRYVANWIEDLDAWRLTATFPLLWAARKVVFLVQGADKAAMVNRILEDQVPFPAQRVTEQAEDVTWLLDAAAASQL